MMRCGLCLLVLLLPSLQSTPLFRQSTDNRIEKNDKVTIDLLSKFFRPTTEGGGPETANPRSTSAATPERDREARPPSKNPYSLLIPDLNQIANMASEIGQIPSKVIKTYAQNERPSYIPSPLPSRLELPQLRKYSRNSTWTTPPLIHEEKRVSSEERLARTNRAFDRMVQFVSLVGQVDAFISDQAKLAVRKLAAMYDEEERYKRGD